MGAPVEVKTTSTEKNFDSPGLPIASITEDGTIRCPHPNCKKWMRADKTGIVPCRYCKKEFIATI
ncbi:hypothetical protein COU01_03225 [Candidatus Falkowbacteria bacterium CG10_big_fil_rev_8_21_14_0_10_44_15]|uniref:Uncharacterized protein n=1 Tax=Candidatus Falkowbacteria bacterium CG10_big_fil_rev_8_21_14_0_10_44_15 TaxID=1974569 RepID=A0A2H0UZA7_9BACT|nr:MAG: hypothetical protein COU01_03225 [Candidatus Falkowbacteria bacterium CG10_big_fil_rev_8_21_14_0_10_44_15]